MTIAVRLILLIMRSRRQNIIEFAQLKNCLIYCVSLEAMPPPVSAYHSQLAIYMKVAPACICSYLCEFKVSFVKCTMKSNSLQEAGKVNQSYHNSAIF